MGTKDTLTRQFMRKPEVFADLFNFCIYDGQQVIQPSELIEMDTTEVALPYAGNGSQAALHKVRDVFKCRVAMTDRKTAYLMLGVENQSQIHYAMPVRNMLYDAMAYTEQVRRRVNRKEQGDGENRQVQKADSAGFLSGFGREDRLVPVVTMVVFFSPDEWDGPTSLHEMLAETDEKVLRLVPDYRINLVAPSQVTQEDAQKLTSPLREAVLFIKYAKDRQKLRELLEQDAAFHRLDGDTARMLNAVTNAKIKMNEGEETVDMCVAIQEMIDEGIMLGEKKGMILGEKKGIAQGMEKGMAQGIQGTVRILRRMHTPDEVIREEIRQQYNLTEEAASRYLLSADEA